jgi:hypothetical protein
MPTRLTHAVSSARHRVHATCLHLPGVPWASGEEEMIFDQTGVHPVAEAAVASDGVTNSRGRR